MGHQLFIKREDMEAAGARFVGTDTHDVWDIDENEEEYLSYTYEEAIYYIPNLGTWTSYDEVHFCIDCNTWGSNYPHIMPWVEANNIPHTLG